MGFDKQGFVGESVARLLFLEFCLFVWVGYVLGDDHSFMGVTDEMLRPPSGATTPSCAPMGWSDNHLELESYINHIVSIIYSKTYQTTKAQCSR